MPNHDGLQGRLRELQSIHGENIFYPGNIVRVGMAVRRYMRTVNFREGWRGHLRKRFASFVLDEDGTVE
jgi:hypothetical protein